MNNTELRSFLREARSRRPELTILENEPMSRHCSFRIGGACDAMLLPSSIEDIEAVCALLAECGEKPFLMGNGTNLLVTDAPLHRIVLRMGEEFSRVDPVNGTALRAESGATLSRLALFAAARGLAGLEFAHGIPGTLGGAVSMNAGAYGGEMKDVVQSVVLYYLPEQRLYELNNEQCRFGYRKSLFQDMGGCVILSAVIRCPTGDGAEIAAKMRELNERRRDKQPLDLPSAGSAFRRPEGYFAAALIEEAGLKGFSVGGAQVSEKHSGFVVNTGNASSHDVYELMMHIRKTVFEHSGVVLEPEMIILPPDYKLADHGPAVPLHNVRPNMPAQEETEQEH